MAALAQYYKNEDHHSEASESTASGSPSEPPMSPEVMKPSRLSKPRGLSLMSSMSTMSPIGLTFDSESAPSPVSRCSIISMDFESRRCSGSAEVAAAAAVDPTGSRGAPKAPPPAPKYPPPAVVAPGLPPAPALPPGVPEPPSAPPQLHAAVAPQAFMPPWPKTAPPSTVPSLSPQPPPVETALGYSPPAMLASGPPVGLMGTAAHGIVAGATMLDASQRLQAPRPFAGQSPTFKEAAPLAQPPVLQQLLPPPESSMPLPPLTPLSQAVEAPSSIPPEYSPLVAPVSALEAEVTQALAVLNSLLTGPTVPPLPPSGCYGKQHISSAVSEGLGAEAAQVAETVARELGEQPVKVLLPWYPAHASIKMFDRTKPAKVAPSQRD